MSLPTLEPSQARRFNGGKTQDHTNGARDLYRTETQSRMLPGFRGDVDLAPVGLLGRKMMQIMQPIAREDGLAGENI